MHSRSKQNGFTLLEMLVSLAIFTVVAVFAVGALVRITGLNRQAQTLQASMSNVSFALESMSREMRVGSNFNCTDQSSPYTVLSVNLSPSNNLSPTSPCPIGSAATGKARIIVFQSANVGTDSSCPLNSSYRLSNAYAFVPYTVGATTYWYLEKAQQRLCNDSLVYGGASNNFYSILDASTTQLTGYELGAFGGPGTNSWVFIRLTGYSGVRVQDQNYFDVQTAISQRIAD